MVNTVTEGGGKSTGDTGVGGALAITVADNVTEARLGTGGGLDITGAYKAEAVHHGSSITTAKGDGVGGSTAVGVAIALGFVDDTARATTDRNIRADGAVSLTATGGGSTEAKADCLGRGYRPRRPKRTKASKSCR